MFKRGEVRIVSNDQPAGNITRKRFWGGAYEAELAGMNWQARTSIRSLQTFDQFDFAGGRHGLAEGRRRIFTYEATIDDVSPYELKRDGDRAVWRDESGLAMVSFTRTANPKGEFRRLHTGSIHVFSACLVPHAPVLTLLGLIQIVYAGFFEL